LLSSHLMISPFLLTVYSVESVDKWPDKNIECPDSGDRRHELSGTPMTLRIPPRGESDEWQQLEGSWDSRHGRSWRRCNTRRHQSSLADSTHGWCRPLAIRSGWPSHQSRPITDKGGIPTPWSSNDQPILKATTAVMVMMKNIASPHPVLRRPPHHPGPHTSVSPREPLSTVV